MKFPEDQYLYVIQHELGPVKIGVAADPESRLSDLQVSCPFELSIRRTANPHNAHKVEKWLHSYFRKYHLRGEWFDIPREMRDFTIPQHIDSDGNPDVDIGVDISSERDLNAEWADVLNRVVLSFKRTKRLTPALDSTKATWENWADNLGDENTPELDLDTGPADGIRDALEDADKNEVRCTNCGHFYLADKGECPTCSANESKSRDDYHNW